MSEQPITSKALLLRHYPKGVDSQYSSLKKSELALSLPYYLSVYFLFFEYFLLIERYRCF
jgi:membrane-bound acyltransferase YfiQ involved in biofilm formation